MSDWIRDLPDWRDHWFMRAVGSKKIVIDKPIRNNSSSSVSAAVSGLVSATLQRNVHVSSAVLSPRQVLQKMHRYHPEFDYLRLQRNKVTFLDCLQGGPFICGVRLGTSWVDYAQRILETGIVTIPKLNEGTLDGRIITVFGYNPSTRLFSAYNHREYGPAILYFPVNYILHPSYSDDFWTVRKL